MSKRRKWFIVLAGVALAITLAVLLIRSDEPRYEGRPLSQWVIDLSPVFFHPSTNQDKARAAIQAIGPDAIPHLLEFITSESDSSFPRKPVQWLLETLPSSLTPDSPALFQWAYLARNEERKFGVPFAFEALGPTAAPAIPRLEQLLVNHTNDMTYWTALNSLAAISTNAQPVLLSLLASSHPDERGTAAAAYATYAMLQTNAEPAVSLLIKNLQDTNTNSRALAALALGEIDVPPELILLALTNVLNDSDPSVRNIATNALLKIAPEVLPNAPPQ